MARKLPRTIARSADVEAPRVVGPRFFRADKRQPDLFKPAASFIPPCKPILREHVPAGPHWQYEIKHDGYRIQAHASGGEVSLFSKSGRDYTGRLPAIRDAVAGLGRDAILDGEAVMLGPDHATDFFALHAAIAGKHAPEAVLYAFDLLSLDGEDLREEHLVTRQSTLAELLAGREGAIMLVEHMAGNGTEMLRHACAMGLEGIVAKRRDRPYGSGERPEWIKVKCTQVEAFAVIGFDPAGRRGVASLKLARLFDDILIRCGSVGSGIGESASRELRAALDAGDHVVVEVEHRGFTPAGELRHPVFRGRA